jgi:hypothetical protein
LDPAQYLERINYAPPFSTLRTIAENQSPDVITAAPSLGSETWQFSSSASAGSQVRWDLNTRLLEPYVNTQAALSVSGTGNPNPALELTSSLIYVLDVRNMTSGLATPLPGDALILHAKGSVDASGDASAQASFNLAGSAVSLSVSIQANAGESKHDQFAWTGPLNVLLNDNTTYLVMIGSGANVNGTGPGNAFASSYVDPTFEIAPQYKGIYDIQLSPDLAAAAGPPPSVPEPTTKWPLTILLLLSYFLLRRGTAPPRVLRQVKNK